MKEERYHLTLDRYDKNIVINALNTLRTQQIQEERPTDPVDELISIDSRCPLLEKLKLELTTPHRDFDRNGRVMVESKKDLAKREIPSPNVADAFIMAFAPIDTSLDIWEQLGRQA